MTEHTIAIGSGVGYLKCIDTYYHGGGWLTALDVRTGKVWQADLAGEMRQ
jgi:serine/threonine protein phosphatase 1